LCLKKKVRFPFVSLGECVSWRKFGIFPFCFVLFNGIPRPPPPLKQHTHLIYIVIPLA